MKDDVISRQAAATIPVMPKEHRHYQTNNLDDAYEQGWNDLQECIENLPTVQPKRKTGQWIDKSNGIEGAWNYCSVCGEQAIDLYDFCPNCGADMRCSENPNS